LICDYFDRKDYCLKKAKINLEDFKFLTGKEDEEIECPSCYEGIN
jgi:hypothetical protein